MKDLYRQEGDHIKPNGVSTRVVEQFLDGDFEMNTWLRPSLEIEVFKKSKKAISISELKEMSDVEISELFLELSNK